jgi:ribosome biogenesis protein YTM1
MDFDFTYSHKSWVSSVQWSPSNPFVLASASHDSTIKLWDIRSSLPLYTITAHSKGSKSLCLALTNDRIFSGGSDCDIKVFKY